MIPMRRVSGGEASNVSGVLHNGFPVRSAATNPLILKEEMGMEGMEEDSHADEVLEAAERILQGAYDELDTLAGNTVGIPGRGGPDAADVVLHAMEELRAIMDELGAGL